ncbi:MAG: site-2 protease family protein [Deltaproteobacteria bacterium]|nr:site-2 protease family protein [Deltaproteobacteria bacterium]
MIPLLVTILFYGLPLLIAVIGHELAHGYAAYLLGDSTAKLAKRLSLNPIRHIDLFMTILLPAFLVFAGSPIVFGGAKPVPINPFNFHYPKRDMMLVAVAGPFFNFVFAAICFLILYSLRSNADGIYSQFFQQLLWLTLCINVGLCIFNLFPILPLDGGRILFGLLPNKLARYFAYLEKYGLLILFAALYLGLFNNIMKISFRYLESLLVK